MKVYFHCAVLAFRQSIGVRVKCGRESLLNAKEVTERGPEYECKNRSPVAYDGDREAMMLYHHVYDYFS